MLRLKEKQLLGKHRIVKRINRYVIDGMDIIWKK